MKLIPANTEFIPSNVHIKIMYIHYWTEYTFCYTLRENYQFLLIQNVMKRPKEVKSTPSEYSGIIMIYSSYLFCN